MTAVCGDRRGTVAGVNLHRRAWDPPCDECRAAGAAYARDRRRRSPKAAAQALRESRVRTWAIKRLIGRHRSEYAALLATAREVLP